MDREILEFEARRLHFEELSQPEFSPAEVDLEVDGCDGCFGAAWDCDFPDFG